MNAIDPPVTAQSHALAARYGTEISLVEAALQRLQVLAPGLASPAAGASASPAP